MAAATSPIFIDTPIAGIAQIATANTARDGTGTLGTIYTAGADGGRVEWVRVQAIVTTTAGVVRLFVQKAGAGTNFLIKELLITAITPSTTVEAASIEYVPSEPILLGAGDILKATTHNSETFTVAAFGGDY